ncbi:MAG: 2-oxo acid dehydrogenase subunit E2, partial [Cryobacterium sp.]|nr:2-oxo acid dehydrogenase subunit E2 [Cryobacterium sp.]
MSTQIGDSPEEAGAGEFGANEWLVEEMYESFLADRNSVDQAWWPVLDKYHAAKTADPAVTAESAAEKHSQDSSAADTPTAKAPDTSAETEAQTPAATPTATSPEPVTKPEPKPEPQIEVAIPAEAPAAEEVETPPNADMQRAARTAGQPVARTTSVAPKEQPIPAEAPRAHPLSSEDAAQAATPERTVQSLKGMAKSLANNMDASLTVPTATSVRTVPAKLLIDNRIVINNHLKRARGGKVSFTHLIGWALVQAVKDFPSQNVYYEEADGKPSVVTPAHLNLGIAIDIPKPDGSRALLVPSIKRADTMSFAEFVAEYEALVSKARSNQLTADDFAGTTISLTNPGGIGTEHSVPRLMKGQGCIIGVGALEYPAEFQGMSPTTLADLGIGKTITLTSTYDHRVIQGAGSG